MSFEFIKGAQGGQIKAWIKGVDLEEAARRQLDNVAALPFIHKHVAIMPDVRWGMGATIGSVIPTKGAVIPAAVGVDIGCGMIAQRTTLTASDLPGGLSALRSEIEARIPHGRTDRAARTIAAPGALRLSRQRRCGRARTAPACGRGLPRSSRSTRSWARAGSCAGRVTSARSEPATISSRSVSTRRTASG